MHVAILIFSSIVLVISFVLVFQTAWILRKTARMERKILSLAAEIPCQMKNSRRQLEDLLALYHQLSPIGWLPRMRGWAASPDFLRVVVEQIQERRPQVILELGSGTSTIVAAFTLESLGRGRLYSLDHEQDFLHITASMIKEHALEERATIIHAPLVPSTVNNQLWYDAASVPNVAIDMLIIDGPPLSTGPMARYPAIPMLFDRLSADARVILDDSARSDEKACVSRWLQEHPELAVRSFDCEKGCVVLTIEGSGLVSHISHPSTFMIEEPRQQRVNKA